MKGAARKRSRDARIGRSKHIVHSGPDGAPEGVTPETGDIAYFAPWGNLAIFYRDFRYSPGLVRLGRIEGNVERFAGDGELKVRIERADAPK